MQEVEGALWRLCETAWSAWLQKDGNVVTRLGEATGNSTRSSAPLIEVNGRLRRAPDLMASRGGQSQYWEVKCRTRSDVDLLTGQHEHWMEHAAFVDYLAVAEAAQMRVWVVLYEAPTGLSSGRWLRIDVRRLREVGRADQRYTSSADVVRAWIWPVSSMEVVAGPEVSSSGRTPTLVDEGRDDPWNIDELEEVERTLRHRRRRPSSAPSGGVSKPAALEPAAPEARTATPENHPGQLSAMETLLASRQADALNVLRLSLGIPLFPHYSVLRVGTKDVSIDDLLGLLQYGIRLLVVSSAPLEETSPEVLAFRETRLLEWAVVPEAAHCGAWVVDGQRDAVPVAAAAALLAADVTGQLNMAQYEVVHTPPARDVVISAGAGTGKTDTMAERVVFLLATAGLEQTTPGQHPEDLTADQICLITFTRDAAAEMRNRIARVLLHRQRLCSRSALPVLAWMLQLSTADILTIHALAKRLTTSGAGTLGLGADLRVSRHTLDLHDCLENALSPRLADLFSRHHGQVPAAHEWHTHLRTIWDALENNGVDLLQLSASPDSPTSSPDSDDCAVGPCSRLGVDWGPDTNAGLSRDVVETTRQVVEDAAVTYRALCLRDQAISTNELVAAARASLRSDAQPPIKRPRFLFVDEFQDTDATQIDLVLQLRARFGATLFVVGDVKQGVYRFRGAEGNAFKEMRERATRLGVDMPPDQRLTRNFRTGARLLASLHPHFAAWGNARLLPYRSVDQLLARPQGRDPSTSLSLRQTPRGAQSDVAAEQIAHWRQTDELGSIGVLCRQNWQAQQVHRTLTRLGTPCELRVGGSFYQTRAVVELRVLLDAVADPASPAALLELCETRWAASILAGEPPAPISASDWGPAMPPPQSWPSRVATISTGAARIATDDLVSLRQRVAALRQMLTRMPTIGWVVECARALRPEISTFPEMADEAERERYGRCLDHLTTLLDATFKEHPLTLERLLAWLRIQIATNHSEDEPRSADLEGGRVVALTVHKAKGQEFDRVIVPFTNAHFGPPSALRTRTAVEREGEAGARILWRWSPTQATYSNAPRAADWKVDDLETRREETRLLYVALTRAKVELTVLTSPPRGATADTATCWSDLLYLGRS